MFKKKGKKTFLNVSQSFFGGLRCLGRSSTDSARSTVISGFNDDTTTITVEGSFLAKELGFMVRRLVWVRRL